MGIQVDHGGEAQQPRRAEAAAIRKRARQHGVALRLAAVITWIPPGRPLRRPLSVRPVVHESLGAAADRPILRGLPPATLLRHRRAHPSGRRSVPCFARLFPGSRLRATGAALARARVVLPGRRMARLLAMALAAVLPVALFVDATIGGEGLQNFLGVIALILAPLALRARGQQRWRLAAWLGLVLGLCLLTKISGTPLFVAIGRGAGRAARSSGTSAPRHASAAPPRSALLARRVALAVWGPLLARNIRVTGNPFPTSFDTVQADEQELREGQGGAGLSLARIRLSSAPGKSTAVRSGRPRLRRTPGSFPCWWPAPSATT